MPSLRVPFSNLERLRFVEIHELLKPIAWPFLSASAEFFGELSGKIARGARNLELQPLALLSRDNHKSAVRPRLQNVLMCTKPVRVS
ncbi:MAG: hypothetical protein DME55_04885 [Verrucomicrobia bacterium]|nr:MAG: hypothetical protein DME55_04885 [Verrucomicrobiota bacterium]